MNLLKKISLYWHTIRYLKWIQIHSRLKQKIYSPRIKWSHFLELEVRKVDGVWLGSIPSKQSVVESGEFVFLGKSGKLTDINWNGSERDKLWRYNQHYFNDLNAIESLSRQSWHLEMLNDWVKQNPPNYGVGWEPYPLSIRVVNWIKWGLAGNSIPELCMQSLVMQVRCLEKKIEWHLLGNHLLANAKALIFSGVYFKGSEAKKWLKLGLEILKTQIPEQILEDGGHFELSPMYHSIILEDLLDLINLSQTFQNQIELSFILTLKNTAKNMLEWLLCMIHPDGQIALFNDAAFGISAAPRDLIKYADNLNIIYDKLQNFNSGIKHLKSSGYVRIKLDQVIAILDVAPIGPDYLPGHAHADTLSFELSIYGQRIVVNGGTSLYGSSPERLRERETKFHSTVEINNENSSEVWSGFRVARRAYPFGLNIDSGNNIIYVGCSHNGYARLKSNPIHRREWFMSKHNLTIVDSVVGGAYKSIARYILHPQISVQVLNEREWCLYAPSGKKFTVEVLEGDGAITMTSYAPEFGVKVQTHCIEVNMRLGRSEVRFNWQ
ncbi:heparinase II/III family protein [Polynucleobacter sp. AP-Ainpum-60-G11]|uniref:heparinase II/III family protein n=1 Tax=Polynucleobacter sp. AP-Ainpum-60-G11 TaxID=2576926 RepID=UPI001BFDC5C3|nr:alginate lyase family protein [Polynucleobacter sp. AP-Ainpum-60-G11]QWE27028.1 alginate lyase family protein [Polynucleobacter sp. AP-Ainpum-60-G11]